MYFKTEIDPDENSSINHNFWITKESEDYLHFCELFILIKVYYFACYTKVVKGTTNRLYVDYIRITHTWYAHNNYAIVYQHQEYTFIHLLLVYTIHNLLLNVITSILSTVLQLNTT